MFVDCCTVARYDLCVRPVSDDSYIMEEIYMSREYKIKMILKKIEEISGFSDILIDILYGLLC